MAYSLIATGAVVVGNNVTLSPPMPAGFSAGQLLLLQSGVFMGTFATPAVAGWTLLSPGVNEHEVALWAKIAVGSDAPPAITWGTNYAYAFVTAYSGNPASLAGIVHASADHIGTTTNSIFYSGLTITQPGCLVICGGSRNKTPTSNAATFAAVGSFAIRNTSIPNGPNVAGVMNDWIQSAATTFSTLTQTYSIADTAAPYNSFSVALLPGTSAPPATTSRLASMGVG
jgi:hypothetical protein